MDEGALRDLLAGVRAGEIHPDEAVRRLRRLPFADLGFARVDHHRRLRAPLGEAVYGPGKAPEQCAAIVAELLAGGPGPVVLTRAGDEQAAAALAASPGGRRHGSTVVWRPSGPSGASVVIAAAGTADGPVATECEATLAAHGLAARRLNDVGVAGLHRLLADLGSLQEADAVVVVAGMEGALPSVVGGLTGAPVVAVPTSTGYGAALEGVTALLSMLASCAAGVTVVGIDNGFGAAAAVLRMLDGARAGT
ncbi:MAG: nickel pincer cofactor biosynthesis protein LarB [bacterium]|nr:nickel pincer cofactor biosynthesis protein LarB [bacterium]